MASIYALFVETVIHTDSDLMPQFKCPCLFSQVAALIPLTIGNTFTGNKKNIYINPKGTFELCIALSNNIGKVLKRCIFFNNVHN